MACCAMVGAANDNFAAAIAYGWPRAADREWGNSPYYVGSRTIRTSTALERGSTDLECLRLQLKQYLNIL